MQEIWGALIQFTSLVLASFLEVFLLWCAATGCAVPFVLAVGAASMRRFGAEYLIACATLLNLTALNGYYASLYFGLPGPEIFFQSLTPFVVYVAGPAIWFSLQAYLDPLFRFRLANVVHFIPAAVAALVTAAYLYSTELGVWSFSMTVDFSRWILVGLLVSTAYGAVSLLKFLKIYREDDGNDQATRYRHRFIWVTGIVFVVMAATAVLVMVMQAISPVIPLGFSAIVLTMLVSLYCRHPEMFAILMESIQSAPHRRTSLPEAVVAHLQRRLGELMSQEKVFIQSDLSMPGLAELAEVTPHQLSEYLNFHIGSNFSRYINGHRVEEVKQRLVSSPSKPIIDIAMECGFNTKSTFNTVFSDVAGITPSAWRKQHRQGS